MTSDTFDVSLSNAPRLTKARRFAPGAAVDGHRPDSDIPGPGRYSAVSSSFSSKGGAKFGTAPRFSHASSMNDPDGSKPRPRTSRGPVAPLDGDPSDAPGPGAYNPTSWRQARGAVSFGTSRRFAVLDSHLRPRSDTPGPNAYNLTPHVNTCGGRKPGGVIGTSDIRPVNDPASTTYGDGPSAPRARSMGGASTGSRRPRSATGGAGGSTMSLGRRLPWESRVREASSTPGPGQYTARWVATSTFK
eukprot:TRINITY_DN56397_c0_g1_i1.p1 TRINITY_DN56397_c0_g1~~TRINITY_DN56397_c0_g1_i1.p1  ORF type:complete len:246 (-),score=6.99 TRINITY_DN56397_c0_g1_i1:251-988(-)